MSETPERTDYRELLRDAVSKIRHLRGRVEELESAAQEPIAIVGMSCRLPGGANDPMAFWELLREGRDAVGPVPSGRLELAAAYHPDPEAPGRSYARAGGFLDADPTVFDAEFFGISPREAASLDPQQRLLLELCWEALEDAGKAPDRLVGSATGVFMGLSTHDYALLLERADRSHIDAYSGTGNSDSVATGRLSYVLGLQGPNLAVDTACSSSLVAVHLAVESLRRGECDLALVGGVNWLLAAEPAVYFSKLRALAADGRCKTFDARADGYGRGEGGGVVVLERLRDAERNGSRVLARIRGSAINHDGRSNGLTAPNEAAQAQLLRTALASAGVAPHEVGYVEAHGTGTALGDPIEVNALAEALAEGREKPLLLGSVKTNIGHLEAAAGVAGLIKAVMVLVHREIPPHLHLEQVNPFVPLATIPAEVPTKLTPWLSDGPRIAGVSSFGFSGTNAHVVLEEAPPASDADEAEPEGEPAWSVLTVSAATPTALAAQAARFATALRAERGRSAAAAAAAANLGRSHLAQRLAVAGTSCDDLVERLTACANGETPALGWRGSVVEGARPEVAFLLTGQGAQYAGMGRRLYACQPVFRAVLDRCQELLRPHLDEPLLSVLHPSAGALPRLDETAYTQPALFSLGWALAELWRSWGVEPGAVLGHSVGEYLAACIAGVFTFEDGLLLVAERGRLMNELPPGGAMIAVEASVEVVRAELAPFGDALSIAAINGPRATVLSGEADAAESVAERLAAQGCRVKPLVVSHAFHSRRMDAILDRLEARVAAVDRQRAQLDLAANLTGALAGAEIVEPSYWRRQLRQPVEFARGVETLYRKGYRVFVELGPGPVLCGQGRACVPRDDARWLPSLRPAVDDDRQMAVTLAELYTLGVEVDWQAYHGPRHRRWVALPTYPFERRPHWGARSAACPRPNPLLGLATPEESEALRFDADLSTRLLPWLEDHRVFDAPILPAAAYAEIGLAAGLRAFPGAEAVVLSDLLIFQGVHLGAEVSRLQVAVGPERAGKRSLEVGVVKDGTNELCAAATLEPISTWPPAALPLAGFRAGFPQELAVERFYRDLEAKGLGYGPAFRGIVELCARPGAALARVVLPAVATAADYRFHPALLDACFQVLGATLHAQQDQLGSYVPMGVERLVSWRRPGPELWCEVTLRGEGASRPGALPGETLSGDLRICEPDGKITAVVTGLTLRRLQGDQLDRLRAGAPGARTFSEAERAHPLLGRALPPVAHRPTLRVWEGDLDVDSHRLAGAYRQRDRVVVPLATLSRWVSAAVEATGRSAGLISSLELHAPLVLRRGEPRSLQVGAETVKGTTSLHLSSRGAGPGAQQPWTLHATATVVAGEELVGIEGAL